MKVALLVVACAVAVAVASAGVVTPPLEGETLRWYTIGDWGGTSSDHKYQTHVAETMSAFSPSFKPNFVINVGDNFYNNGVSSVDDPQWTSKFEDMYFNNPTDKVEWWSVLGNHDYIENPQAEVEYTGMGNGMWQMPERYYSKTFTFGAGTTAEFVFIDTIMLSSASVMQVAKEEMEEGVITQEDYDKLDARMSDPALDNAGTVQLDWIKKTLSASTADWLFVVGHFPVYSGGAHGDTKELCEQLKPLLEQYNVDAYMDGHDHTLQALQKNGVYYYVSGAGCQHESHKCKTLKETLYATSDYHGFGMMSINATTFAMSYLDDHSNVLYMDVHARRPKTSL